LEEIDVWHFLIAIGVASFVLVGRGLRILPNTQQANLNGLQRLVPDGIHLFLVLPAARSLLIRRGQAIPNSSTRPPQMLMDKHIH